MRLRFPTGRLRRLRDCSNGFATIEFALFAAPVLGLLMIGVIDIGTLLWDQMRVAAAARAGAQYAAMQGWSASASKITCAVVGATGAAACTAPTGTGTLGTISASPTPTWPPWCGCPSSSGITQYSCSSTPSCSNPGHYVTVSAQASFTPILNWNQFLQWSGVSLPSSLSASAVVQVYP